MITTEEIFDAYESKPRYVRTDGAWTMSQETLDQIKAIPDVGADQHYQEPGLLLGRPIRIRPDVTGIRFGLDPDAPKRVLGRKFLEALGDAGIIRVGDYVRRVVIDASIDNALTLYVERIGDDRLLQVATSLDGIEIKYAPVEDSEHTQAGDA